LPGSKVSKEIAEVRGLNQGETAISPATFPDFHGVQDFKAFAEQVRERTGGIPIGFKIAASHIEKDIQFALDVGVDYIILVIITGGLRTAEDFAKAMMLGADAIAVSNSALQAIGCLGMRACGSNNCPVGIATQKESLRSRLIIESSAKQLNNYFTATNELIKVVARACGYDDVSKFNHNDLSTFDRDMHQLSGINYAGVL